MLKGLPGSGKTTWAKQYQKDHPGTKRVNKDELRSMIDDGVWSDKNEVEVLFSRDCIVNFMLLAGRDVIVDDTNFAPKHESILRKMASKCKADFEIKMMDTPLGECIVRDMNRPKPVGEKVIRDMYDKYLRKPKELVPYDPALPDAIICDIDGTLAHMNGKRGAFDWKKVGDDDVDNEISDLLRIYSKNGTSVILVSGRDAVCRPETEVWLYRHGISYKHLYMRPEGDNRKDVIVKKEILEANIKGKYNVLFVLDDRDQVVKMWREEGYKCLQVAEGSF